MGIYVLRRILMTLLVVVGAAILIFVLMSLVPGDPAEIILGPMATEADLAAKRHELGTDQPLIIQMGRFLFNAFFRLDLGTSWFRSTPVLSGMLNRLPRTVLLGLISIILTTAIGIPIGVNAAIHANGWQDRTLIVVAMILQAVPQFLVALVLIIIFSMRLGWLPSYGIETWTCYILPVISGAIGGFAGAARQTRASVLDVVRADYIVTARAKGVREHDVIYRHMLPNALIPILTQIGGQLAGVIGGTIILEKIFSFPGVGLYLSDAINTRDYPIIRGCGFIISFFTAIIMLLVDLAYAYVDPRIKAQYINSSRKKGKIRG